MIASDKPQKACGPDEIPARIYHDYSHELAPMLRCIYTNSLTTRAMSQMIGKVQQCVPYIKKGLHLMPKTTDQYV